jgi:UDP-glucose 4-epimerase
MKFLVLGGSGFIGSHLAEALQSIGEVAIFDLPGAPYSPLLEQQGIKIFAGNFLDETDTASIFEGVDVLYHLISTTVPKTSNNDHINNLESNVIGSLKLLKLAKEAGVKRVVFISSGGTVYGIPQSIPVTESHPTNPISGYGISKLMIEKYLHLFWKLYGLDYVILRVANAYGARQLPGGAQGAIANFLSKALKEESLEVWGDGTVVRDYIYIDDIVNALVSAGIQKDCGQQTINISSGRGYNLNEVIDIIKQVTDKNLDVNYISAQLHDVPVNILENSLAKEILNWKPSVDLVEGIRRTFNWLSENYRE